LAQHASRWHNVILAATMLTTTMLAARQPMPWKFAGKG
jgi:hypothetical protein